MTLEKLKELNPTLPLYGVEDPAFAAYGRVLDLDTREIVETGLRVPMPESGVVYEASREDFESLAIAESIQEECFGELPVQVGYCTGQSYCLNGWEWHTCSEVNVAVTDLVLILGLRGDIRDGRIDSSTAKAFLLKKGTAVEVYATSLHYCPCKVHNSGFGCVVALPKGTNLPLSRKHTDPLLRAKNKWLIAHVDNQPLIDRGTVPGITGENYAVRGE